MARCPALADALPTDRPPASAAASAVKHLFAAPVPYPLLAPLGAPIPPQNIIAVARGLILLLGIPRAAGTKAVHSVSPAEKQIYG